MFSLELSAPDSDSWPDRGAIFTFHGSEYFIEAPSKPGGLSRVQEAIFLRLQELDSHATGQNERTALQMAAKRLLQIKTSKLGFPPIPGASGYLTAVVLGTERTGGQSQRR